MRATAMSLHQLPFHAVWWVATPPNSPAWPTPTLLWVTVMSSTASPALSQMIVEHLKDLGYSVGYTDPYKGVWLVRRQQ